MKPTVSGQDAPLLSVRDVSLAFGGIQALNDVSFDVRRGQIVGVIGPNGAGKTSLFNCLSGLYRPNSGDILFKGRSILLEPSHARAGAGIGRTFQNLALFGRLTARDNIRVGSYSRTTGNVVCDVLKLPRARRTETDIGAQADEMLDYLQLTDVADKIVSELPFGTQKRVELGRALTSCPELLLLDEPAGGLNHEEVFAFGDLVRAICRERNITMLLVEHHVGLVMSLVDHVVALNFGSTLAEGTPAEIQQNPAVIEAYLGTPCS